MDPSEIKQVMVIGAGTMGHSIAEVYAQASFEVYLVDIDQKKLDHAIKLIKSNLEVLKEFNRIQENDISKVINLIQPTTDLKLAAKKADLVVEAVSEIPELKENIFKQLSDYCKENIIFASNTSSLDIFKIAKDIKNPSRLITHHYYAPAHIIPLVEIAPGKKTSKEIVDFSVKLMKKLGKKPIVMKKFTPSYIVNKIQSAISGVMYEILINNLATVEQIDIAVKTSLGVRLPIVGIVQSQDFTGLDLVYDILKSKGIMLPPIKERVERGDLGVKSGKGFYDYKGRGEEEILQKRDRLYLKMLDHLEKIDAFKPI